MKISKSQRLGRTDGQHKLHRKWSLVMTIYIRKFIHLSLIADEKIKFSQQDCHFQQSIKGGR